MRMIRMVATSVVLAIMVLGASATLAGWFGPDGKTDTDATLAKLFGQNTAFTATAQVVVKDKAGKEAYTAEVQYAYLEGKMRTDIDMGKTKIGQQHAEVSAQMEMLGLNRVVTVSRPDKKTSYVIYPGMGAYCELPAKSTTGTPVKPPTIERKEIGRETIDGHPCIKYLVTVTDEAGQKQEITAWQATDLNNFPIKTEMKADNNTITTTFKNIKLAKPPAGLFEAPPGCKKYDSVQEMMMGSMQDLLKNLK